jgi:hypothetical protein
MVFENYACPTYFFELKKGWFLVANVTGRGCGLGFGESDMLFIAPPLNS